MRRIRTTIQALIGATVIAGGMAALTPAAWAITIPVACSENALVAAVTLANSTSGTVVRNTRLPRLTSQGVFKDYQPPVVPVFNSH